MIVIDGIDGSGKGVQTRRLHQALMLSGLQSILTREPGGSKAAEEIRKLLVEGEPDKWDSMTELLLMYAARRSHLNDTIRPAMQRQQWVVCDRFADSSRAFQGIAGDIGLETVEQIHQLVMGSFEPDLVLILDIPESVALNRALARGDGEDRFEKKGADYQARVRQAFLKIASTDSNKYQVIDANQPMDEVTRLIFNAVNRQFELSLEVDSGIQ